MKHGKGCWLSPPIVGTSRTGWVFFFQRIHVLSLYPYQLHQLNVSNPAQVKRSFVSTPVINYLNAIYNV